MHSLLSSSARSRCILAAFGNMLDWEYGFIDFKDPPFCIIHIVLGLFSLPSFIFTKSCSLYPFSDVLALRLLKVSSLQDQTKPS